MSRRVVGFVWATLLGAAGSALGQVVPRQVAAPASDIESGLVRLPDPASTPTVSFASLSPLRFERRGAGDWFADVALPIERAGSLTLALLSPDAAGWRLLAAPAGAPLRAIDDTFALERRIGFAGDELPGWIVDRRDVRGAPAGSWIVRVEATAPSDGGWLLASSGTDLRAEAHVTTQRLIAGEPIGIAARAAGRALASVEHASVALETLGGSRELAMFDDGAHEDGERGDGTFGALVPQDLLGAVRATVDLRGTTRDGRAFVRSSQVAFEVLGPRLELTGIATASAPDPSRLSIAIEAIPRGPEQRLHASAEVWGIDAAGKHAPVCWLSRMLEPVPENGVWHLPLELDLHWLDVAGASTPLELRNVRVQDPDTESVLGAFDSIALADVAPRSPDPRRGRAVTPEMLTGGVAIAIGSPVSSPPPFANLAYHPALMLVHGYCSNGMIWPPADFTQPKLEFLDPNANRSHDQFAQLLSQAAQAVHITSFGVVAHSQGGPAALHLLTYYSSGLDKSGGGRRIQSVSAPYQGTPLASLGFFLCGSNSNMTPSGSATWLAGIPSWARAEVSTWTVSNSGSACNFFTGLLLADPDDGTVEKVRAELPGGNNMGHTVGWCHTTGMSNPAVYTDHARNVLMDAAAAR